jgi:hypothetical protein
MGLPALPFLSLSRAVELVVERSTVSRARAGRRRSTAFEQEKAEGEAREWLRQAGMGGLIAAHGHRPMNASAHAKVRAAHPDRERVDIRPEDWSQPDWPAGSLGLALDAQVDRSSLEAALAHGEPPAQTHSAPAETPATARDRAAPAQKARGAPPVKRVKARQYLSENNPTGRPTNVSWAAECAGVSRRTMERELANWPPVGGPPAD